MPSTTAAPPQLRGLIPGLSLHLADAGRPRDAVRLSAGTQSANELGPSEYAERSFVPRLPWRAPTDAEWAALTRPGTEIEWPGGHIAVFRVPDAVLEPFAPLRELCREERDLHRLVAAGEGVAGRAALIEATRYALTLAHPQHPEIDAPAVHAKIPPGAPTMTTGRDRRLTGLHVDSWYRRELDGRAGSPNRISINLGSRDRHFLCVNLPLRALAESAPEAYEGVKAISFTMPRDFLRDNPDYPVLKLTIAPGQAYIAPTENIIHDGYAEQAGEIDLQFTCRGYFDAPKSVS